MTKKKDEPKESKRPTHDILVVHGEDDKARWTKIGAAWMHKDLKGASLVFDALPNGGRTVLREIKAKDDADTTSATGGQQ